MNKNQIFFSLGAILLGLIIILSISAAMISENMVKDQISDNISYDEISVVRFPYPSIELKNVKLGKHNAARVKLKISLPSLLLFSYNIKNIDIEDVSISTGSNLTNLEDFHNAARYVLDEGNHDFRYIGLSKIALYHQNKKIYSLNSANLKCTTGKCELFGIDKNQHHFSISALLDSKIMRITSSITSNNIDLAMFEKYDLGSGNFIGDFKATIKSIDDINIVGELAGNNDVAHFRNIVLESKMLEGKADYASFKEYGGKLKLDLNSFNLNSDQIKNIMSESLYMRLMPKDFEVHIKDAKVAENGFKLIDIFGSNDAEKVKISEMSAISDYDDVINVRGDIYLSEYGPVFDGNIDCKYHNFSHLLSLFKLESFEGVNPEYNFTFNSDIYASAKNYHFSKINSKVADVQVNGDLGIILLQSTPRIVSSLDIKNFNFIENDYVLAPKFFEYLKSLVHDMKEEDYLTKFNALKEFPYKASLDINFYDAILGKYKLDNINANIRVKNAHIALKKLDIESEMLSLHSNGELQSWGIKPIMFFNITGGHLDQFSYSLLKMHDYIIENIDPKKIQFNSSIAFDNLSSDDGISLLNLRAMINSDDAGGVNIKDMLVDVFGGRLISTSYILPSSFTIEGVYGYNNFLLSPIAEYITKDKSLISGIASANGKFKMNLEDKDFISKLYLNGSYIAKFITLNNFGIDDYIENITEKEYDAKNRLEYDTYNASYKGVTELPLYAGSIEVKDGLVSLKDNDFNTKYTNADITGGFKMPSLQAKDLMILFEFDDPRQPKLNIRGKKLSKKKINIPMKVEGNIFTPVRTLDLSDLKKKLFRGVKFDIKE